MKHSVESLLEHDHESLDQVLNQLDEELAKPNVVRAFELLDFFWARLAVHIRGENLHLFPAIESAPTSLFTGKDGFPTRKEAQSVLARLRSDHDFFMKELAQIVKIMRESVASETMRPEEVKDVKQRITAIARRLE
ncbi:MAG: hemerythrin domain-containing protein, partial [Pyrinomonadaceae bacterium]